MRSFPTPRSARRTSLCPLKEAPPAASAASAWECQPMDNQPDARLNISIRKKYFELN
jgi:hypothetical protein